jgi:hypothetical protein
MDVTLPIEVIRGKIYLIRGQKILLDRDLAEMYGVETRSLNQAVRRNINRFPEDFMLTLTRDEIRNLSQIVISPGLKHAPNVFAFTEQGVAMLSSVLNSDRAVQVNIAIMRAFVQMRELAASNRALARKLEELEKKYDRHDKQFIEVFDAIRSLMAQPEKKGRKIGFGQGEKD